MSRNSDIKKKARISLLLGMFLLTTIYTNSTLLFSSVAPSIDIDEEIIEDDDNDLDPTSDPVVSTYGEDPWWNASFNFRRLINITNPHAVDLEDTIVSITFNYTAYVNEGKMNSSLKDVRIIENGILRTYFIQLDYPNLTLATVWFETNLTASSMNQDTYMYYGNNTVTRAGAQWNTNDRFGKYWWRLDEDMPGSPEAEDSIGNNHGEFRNSPTYVSDGVYGNSVDLDGNAQDDHVEMDATVIGDTLIVAGWVKGGGSGQMPWGIDRNGGTDMDPYHSGSYIYNNRGDGTGNPYRDEFSAQVPFPTDGLWHHYIWENIGGGSPTSKYWIDGVLAGTAAYNNPTTTLGRIFQISCWPINDNYHWNGQVDDVRIFEYGLSVYDVESIYNLTAVPAILNEEQNRGTVETLDVIIYDVDGRVVPNAYVSLVNMSVSPDPVFTEQCDINGLATFTKIPAGIYNITVKYNDTSSATSYDAYNSTVVNFKTVNWDMYTFTNLYHEIEIQVDLWTIDFEIFDWDNELLPYSYIDVSLTKGGPVIDNLRLTDGKATFVGENRTEYYYTIYYDNADYADIPVALNQSIIKRNMYQNTAKHQTNQFLVNNTNILTGTDFRVQQNIYTGNSINLQQILTSVNVTLRKMVDNLVEVSIYYLDKDGAFDSNSLIYFKDDYTTETKDIIEINIRDTPDQSSNLIADNYLAYGLRVDVQGVNYTAQCNGTIDVSTTESCYVSNTTEMSKMYLRVIDSKGNPVPSTLIFINKSLANGGNRIATLITNGTGYAKGEINTDTIFYYERGETYNFSLRYFGEDKNFKINKTSDPGQWYPSNLRPMYNFTLKMQSTLVFQMQISITNFLSEFRDLQYDSKVVWGKNMTFAVNYTTSENGAGGPWEGLDDPDEIVCIMGGKTFDMQNAPGQGNFSITLNSSIFSASDDEETYLVTIEGSKLGFISPMSVVFTVTIYAIEMNVQLHDYDNMPQVITAVSENFNETINITVSYSNTSLIRGAKLSYVWSEGSGSDIGEDPMNPGYYTFEIDTSLVDDIGTYPITITMALENHTTEIFFVNLQVTERETTVNGTADYLYISESIYVEDVYNFTFRYLDTASGLKITDAEASYTLQTLDSDGDPTDTEIGTLRENRTSTLYDLDLVTELMEISKYFIFLTFNKKNYEDVKIAISFEVEEREIDSELSKNFKDKKVEVIHGEEIKIEIDLTDPTRDDMELEDADITLIIGDEEFEFDDKGDGLYELIFTTEEYEAFFVGQTLTGTIKIEKDNYGDEEIEITIVINMDEGPIEGVPTFWFLMVVGAIAAVVIALSVSKLIASAKIPKFVKKTTSIKKSIKTRKEISESDLYPEKTEFYVKRFGDRYEILGIALGDLLGVQDKKSKTLADAKKSIEKKEGGAD